MICPYCKKYILGKQQEKIYNLLKKKRYRIIELHKETGISEGLLCYHLDILMAHDLIIKYFRLGKQIEYGLKDHD